MYVGMNVALECLFVSRLGRSVYVNRDGLVYGTLIGVCVSEHAFKDRGRKRLVPLSFR